MKILVVISIILTVYVHAESLPMLVWFIKELKYSVVVARVVSVDSKSPAGIITGFDGKSQTSRGLFEASILVEDEIFSPKKPEDKIKGKGIFLPYNKKILLETRSDNPNLWKDGVGRKSVIMVFTDDPKLELKVSEACIGFISLDKLSLIENEIYKSITNHAEYLEKWSQSYKDRSKQ